MTDGPYRTNADSFEENLRKWRMQHPNGKVVEVDVGRIEWTIICVDGYEHQCVIEGDAQGQEEGLIKYSEGNPRMGRSSSSVRDRTCSAQKKLIAGIDSAAKCGWLKADNCIIPWHQVKRIRIDSEGSKVMRWYEWKNNSTGPQSGGPM